MVIEPLNRTESNLINTVREAEELRKAVGEEYLQTLADSYHFWLGSGSLDELREAGGHLRHVHVARTLGRGLPAAGDECDWQGFFAVLREIGYDGDVSIEAKAPETDCDAALGRSLAFLRSI